MKQFLLYSIVFTITSAVATAQSALRVTLTDNTPITVAVDGRYFNTRGQSVTVSDIPWGRHYLKIFVHAQRSNGDGYERTIFEGRVKTYRGHITLFSYDPYSGQTVSSNEDMRNGSNNLNNGNTNQSYNHNNLNNYDQRDNNVPPLPYDQQRQPDVVNANTNNTVIPDTLVPINELPDGTPLASPVASPVTNTDKATTKGTAYNKTKAKVKALVTDTEKIDAAKEGLKKVALTSAQVATALDWFNFESTRLDFAKWAHAKTTDPQNFNKVVDKLTIKSNKKELQDFIKGYKK